MKAQTLHAIRVFMNREPDGDYRFVTACLAGTRGEEAKAAAEVAITVACELDRIDDDSAMADQIIDLVQNADETSAVSA